MENQELAALRRALERERAARKIAEKILEEKSSELYNLNQQLINVNTGLEKRMQEATEKVELIARFPAENPSAVIRTDKLGEPQYLNRPGKKIIEIFQKEGVDIDLILKGWAKDVSEKQAIIKKELISSSKSFSVSIHLIIEHNYVNFYFSETTTQKIAEEKLIRSEEKYRSVIENMKLGLLEVDNNKTITKAYTHFCNITGYNKNELIGKNVDTLFPLAHGNIKTNQLLKAINKESNYLWESEIRRKDGSFVWVLISSATLYSGNGEIIGSIGIHLDITLQKENERALRSARLKAEESTRAKEQFLANMSHEIRTPLNAISGMTDLLIKTKINNDQKKLLDAMERSSQNLLVVINDILDFSKIESGKLKFEKIGFRLDEIIKHVILTKKLDADEKGISLEYHLADNVKNIFFGDPFRLNQILLNFINNAVKFTEKGSVKIIISSILKNEYTQTLKINIVDTGKGISPSKIENIFEAFHQEDASITRSYGGTGLGLTITKRMIEMQGGELSVTSELNKGSDFQFTISYNLGEDKDLPINSNTKVDTTRLSGLRILIAEDNEFNQILMNTIFDQFDVDLTIVDNGQKVIQKLENNSYDIILMDIQMPIMDGVQATEIIRAGDTHKDIPIIALTANAFKDELDQYKNYGVTDCLSKPFKSAELYNKIIKLTDRVDIDSNDPQKRTNNQVTLYDLEKLSNMLGGNKALIEKMVESFLAHTPPLLEELYIAGNNNNWDEVSKICHRLKASYKTMSIHSLEKVIHLLETEISTLSNQDRENYIKSIKSTSVLVFESLEKESFQNTE